MRPTLHRRTLPHLISSEPVRALSGFFNTACCSFDRSSPLLSKFLKTICHCRIKALFGMNKFDTLSAPLCELGDKFRCSRATHKGALLSLNASRTARARSHAGGTLKEVPPWPATRSINSESPNPSAQLTRLVSGNRVNVVERLGTWP